MKVLRRALHYMAPYWGWQMAALLCALAVTASNFIWPYVNKVIIDNILWPQAGRDAARLEMLNRTAILVVVTILAGTIFGLARAYLFARVGEQAAADLRQDLFRHLHVLPMGFYDVRKTGGIMSVVQNDVEALQGLYSSTLVDLITNLLTAVIAVGMMFWQNPRLALMGLPVPALFAVALALFGRPLRNTGKLVREETGGVQEVLQESISGAREVKAFVRADSERIRFMEKVAELVRARIGMALLGAANGAVANVIAVLGMIFVMVMGSRLVIKGQMTAGEVILFINVLGMLFGPASAFINLFTQIAGAVGAADRVFEFLDTPVEKQGTDELMPERVQGRVRFAGVNFRYEGDGPEVLHDIEMEVSAGEVVALVGPSGSGKTTLVSLLPRLYDTAEGRILIDGRDIRSLSLGSLRRLIAVVPQEPFLFGTTVAENIAFGREKASHEEIIAAAKAANANDFIAELPGGYDTPVGERGARLSVGQKQRIAIARAILRDPRILILDEATSAQDSESERLVQDAMRRLMQGRTSFVIAHRLSTVQTADRIVVLDGGRIAQEGRHADLVATDGIYARLHALQFAPEQAEVDSRPVMSAL